MSRGATQGVSRSLSPSFFDDTTTTPEITEITEVTWLDNDDRDDDHGSILPGVPRVILVSRPRCGACSGGGSWESWTKTSHY
jgi:hypothetical protein